MRTGAAAFLVLVAACTARPPRDHRPAAPRAEVQINVCSTPDHIVGALGLGAASLTEVWYFDDRSLDLFQRGLVFRLRITGGKPELTMKVADQDCAIVPGALIPRPDGKCEYDLHGNDLRGAVSISTPLDYGTGGEMIAGHLALAQLLSDAQRRYLKEAVHLWPLTESTEPLGPVYVDAYRGQEKRFVVESWRLPSGQRFAEISRKVALRDAWRTRAELMNELAGSGVRACENQSSQARAKLVELVSGRVVHGR